MHRELDAQALIGPLAIVAAESGASAPRKARSVPSKSRVARPSKPQIGHAAVPTFSSRRRCLGRTADAYGAPRTRGRAIVIGPRISN